MTDLLSKKRGSTPAEILKFENVSISYPTRAGEVPAVVDVSLTVREGESVGLVGESGCGKTTMAYAVVRHLAGGGRITSGRILFRGQDIGAFTAKYLRQVRGPGIAMVYQEAASALNPCLTIGEQLAEVLVTHANESWGVALEKSAAMIREVGIPDVERILAAYPHQLSGGQQQRVVIATALLANPALLILDEPTTGLDVTVEAEVVDLIAGLREKFGTSLLYISHNLALIAQVCDRVAVMYSGQIIEEGNLADIYGSPLHPYTRGLFRCIPDVSANKTTRPLVPISGTVTLPQDRPKGCYFNPRCPHALAGECDTHPIPFAPAGPESERRIRCVRWRDLPEEETARGAVKREKTLISEEEILRVEHLKKHYPAEDRSLKALFGFGGEKVVKANEDLTFGAHRREILGIVGESGCGKSSFAKIVLGLEQATDGKVSLCGTELAQLPVTGRTPEQLRSVQMVFQDPDDTLNPSYTVGSQVARALRKLNPQLDRRKIDGRVRDLLAMTKLPPEIMHRRPRQLSGGQKQRIAIARAFAGDPELIVADEPLSALDVSVQAAITEVLMQIQRQRNATLLIISHDLRLVHYIADSVVVIYLGHVMEAGPTSSVFSPPYHPYTELLLSSVPSLNPDEKQRRILASGPLPSALDPPKGCPFHTRCPRSIGDICSDRMPEARIGDQGHRIACHIPLDELEKMQAAYFSNAASGKEAGD